MKNYFSFSQAIEEIKKGNTVQRKWWRGKGNYIYLEKGVISSDYKYKEVNCLPKFLFNVYQEGVITKLPYIVFSDTTNCLNVGWQPNANDMLANDWCLVD